MALDNAYQDARFDVLFPKSPYLPDTCAITTQASAATQDSLGYSTGAKSNVVTGLACRIQPILGRFNRIEGFLDLPNVDADFLATILFRTDVQEKHILKVTASTNTEWVDREFDVILVQDPDGTHSHLELLLKFKEMPS